MSDEINDYGWDFLRRDIWPLGKLQEEAALGRRSQLRLQLEPLAGHDLEGVAGADVLLRALHHGLVVRVRRVRDDVDRRRVGDSRARVRGQRRLQRARQR